MKLKDIKKGENNMAKELVLICGRSGSGKDTYARILDDYGYKGVCSYTTRKRREGEGDTHIFIDKSEVDDYPDKVAVTEINDVIYFSTKKQLDEADYYIIDPHGIETLNRNYPELKYRIIYIYAPEEVRKARAISRGNAYIEADIFEKRNASEDAQFKEFEQSLFKKDNIIIHHNTGSLKDVERWAIQDFNPSIFQMYQYCERRYISLEGEYDNGYDCGYYEGYHNAMVDVMNKLGIPHDAVIF